MNKKNKKTFQLTKYIRKDRYPFSKKIICFHQSADNENENTNNTQWRQCAFYLLDGPCVMVRGAAKLKF